MYVYMYVCMYICMYVCMYVYMYVCIYVCMYICMYVYMYVYMYVCMIMYYQLSRSASSATIMSQYGLSVRDHYNYQVYGAYFMFNVYCSVHRRSILIIVQLDATQSSLFIIPQVHCTCFRCQPHPSSGLHKTVTTASCIGHIFCAATSLQYGQARGSCTVPEAVVTVLCTPDDGCV